MASKTVEAILRLSSKLGSMDAFRKMSGNLEAIDRKARAFNRTQGMIAAGTRDMNAMLMRYAAPTAVAALGVTSAKAFAAIERRMERIGITADASSEQTADALAHLRQIAMDLETPIENVVEGFESLVASGKSLDEALAFLPSVAGTAHAADAAFGDMATTADAVGTSFAIAAPQMERAFDILAKGGKAGKFELKDMAAELPSLAPAFAALGYQGEEGLKRLVAALQTVRLETGTSGEAATAFMDVLTKLDSNTISNNFRKNFGVNIRAEMEAARAAGEDLLDAFVRLSVETVKGDMSKLPQLFTDKQMLIGMRALINNTDEFAGFMRELADASGTVRADLVRLGDDAQGSFDKIGNSWGRLKEEFGKGLFEAGAGRALDAAADYFERGTAIEAALKKRGDGVLDRARFYTSASESEKDELLWRSGYRSKEQRRAIDAYSALGRSRAAAPALPAGQMPLPAPRPAPGGDASFEADYRRQQAARPYHPGVIRPFAAGASPRDAERESMAALRADPNGVAEAIDEALSRGGESAKSSIMDAARAVNDAGGEAGSIFSRMVEGVGRRIGEEAAASFRANVGTVTVNARVSGPGRSPTGRNTGLSMPEAGE
ncbi:phage tail tape measure protein [Nitratireductor sp. StC3]|uniref:phage tail tape measure protein n=1 Tax=Nitratireductor sp. StC3 TaxID=2126741 RepID=UPI000D0DC15E|nr:phage tail tape measure protein [Nitratireductor sp. StC3]PSM20208.1 phage tail tape measure protein [Nitratireductor sp. StC3]